MDVVELFGLSGIQHTPISIKNARVSQVRDLPQILGELFPGTWDSTQGRQAVLCLCQATPPCGPGVDANTGNDLSCLVALQSQSDCNLQPIPGE